MATGSHMTAGVLLLAVLVSAYHGRASESGSDYYVVQAVGTSSVRVGDRLSQGQRLTLGQNARVRLISSHELVEVRGPKDIELRALDDGAGGTGRAGNAAFGAAFTALEADVFNPERPRNLRNADHRIPAGVDELNGDASGHRCVRSDRPVIWTADHRDSSGLEIVEHGTGETVHLFPSGDAEGWRWPDSLPIKDGEKYDLYWNQADQTISWTLHRGANIDPARALAWYVENECHEQVLVLLRSMTPDRQL